MPYSINREHVISKQVGDEITLVHVESTYYYGLNPTGTFVWNLLEQHDAAFEELVAAVSAEYEVEPATIRSDIQSLLQELVREQLILER